MGARPSAAHYALLALLFYGILFLFTLETWVVSLLQLGTYALTAWVAWRAGGGNADWRARLGGAGGAAALAIIAAAVVWIGLQLVTGHTVYPRETLNLLLYWVTAGCLVFLGAQLGGSVDNTRWLLRWMVYFSLAMAVIGAMSYYTAGGKYYWLIQSQYSYVVGPFSYRNYFANLIELMLPVAVYFAFEDRKRSLFFSTSAAIMYSAVLATASRSGAGLLTLELVLLVFLLPARGLAKGGIFRSTYARLLVLAAAFVVVMGYELILQRFQMEDPYTTRREYAESSLAMAKAQPVWGTGLGTWTIAYPEYAILDLGTFANAAHNDWAQWAAEGGIPFFVLMVALAAATVRPALRTVWGLGVPVVYLHAFVDYPFYRLGLAAWTFVVIGLLFAGVREDPPTADPRPSAA